MALLTGKLTKKLVENLGPGRHGDGNGLYLVVDPSGARRWIVRVTVKGQRNRKGAPLRTDFGLGGADLVTLHQARERALEYRRMARQGLNPRFKPPRDPETGAGMGACHVSGDPRTGRTAGYRARPQQGNRQRRQAGGEIVRSAARHAGRRLPGRRRQEAEPKARSADGDEREVSCQRPIADAAMVDETGTGGRSRRRRPVARRQSHNDDRKFG